MRQNVLFFGVIPCFLRISALSFAQTITLTLTAMIRRHLQC